MTTVTAAPKSAPRSAQLAWVRPTYYGAGLAVRLTQPVQWAPHLPARGFHYSATLAYLSSFALRPICRHAPHGLTCDPLRAGPYPPGGLTLTVTVAGFGPGLISRKQVFAHGTPIIVGGRHGVLHPADPGGCVGTGATNAVSYAIEDGQQVGFLGLEICWRGASPALSADIGFVVRSIRIAADPRHRGPWPD